MEAEFQLESPAHILSKSWFEGQINGLSVRLIASRWHFDRPSFLGSKPVFRICSFFLSGALDGCPSPLSQTSLDEEPKLNLAASASTISFKTVVNDFIVAKKIKSLYRSLASNFTGAPPWRLNPNWKPLAMNNNLGTRVSSLDPESAKRVSPQMKEVIQSVESTKAAAKDQGKLFGKCLQISHFGQFCRIK